MHKKCFEQPLYSYLHQLVLHIQSHFLVLQKRLDNLHRELQEYWLQGQLIQQRRDRLRHLHCKLLERHLKRRHSYQQLQRHCMLLVLHQLHNCRLGHLQQCSHLLELLVFLFEIVVYLFDLLVEVNHELHRSKRVQEVLFDIKRIEMRSIVERFFFEY